MFISPLNISPLAKKGASALTVLEQFAIDYGFLNMYSSEKLLVSGTTTTLYDYLGEHDLVNPSSVNQPTFNASSANFNNLPSLTFDGTTDHVTKAVSNWRGSDSTGVFVSVFKVISGAQILSLASANNALNLTYTQDQITTTNYRFNVLNESSPDRRAGKGSTNISSGSFVGSYSCSGADYAIFINGVKETYTAVVGANDGAKWLDSNSTRDDLSIGAVLRSAPFYSNIEFVMSGYKPFVSEAEIIALQAELKTYYGI